MNVFLLRFTAAVVSAVDVIAAIVIFGVAAAVGGAATSLV